MATLEEKEAELQKQLKVYLSNPHNVEVAAEEVFNDLVDTVVMGIVFDVHRAAKSGLLEVEEGAEDEDSQFEFPGTPGVDIFGQQRMKKPIECVCPNCKRSLGALWFARHLGKCMGMDRHSSRVASQRIANSKKNVGYSEMLSFDDDSELGAGSDRRRKRKDRNGAKRSKNQKTGRNGDVAAETTVCSDLSNTHANYDSMTNEEKKNLLMQICGVISVNTRKLCTRSMRCPQHSDEQRRAVRAALLNPQGGEMSTSSELLQVEVHSYNDGEGPSVRDTVGPSWELEHSNTSSPADSASTSSSSSKKRDKLPKSKSKSSSKSHKGSPSFVICGQE